MKNFNEAVKCPVKRQLTAKGYKFLNRCNHIIAEANASNIYAAEMKPIKEKLKTIVEHLLIDKGLTIAEVTELIKQSNFKLQ